MKPMKHYIAVVKVGLEYRTIPAAPIVGEGDTIVWANYTGGKVEILLPKPLRGQLGKGSGSAECAHKKEFSVKVKKDPTPGFYAYSVFVHESNDMAVGNSAPGVIIKR